MRGKEEVGGDAIEELRPSDVRIVVIYCPYSNPERLSYCNPEGCLIAILKVVLRWLSLERENRIHRQILGFKFGEWGNLIHEVDLSHPILWMGVALCSLHNILFAYSVHISM